MAMTNKQKHEEWRKFILEALERSPKLTKHHFQRNCGINPKFLALLESEGVKFGAPTPPKNKSLTIGQSVTKKRESGVNLLAKYVN